MSARESLGLPAGFKLGRYRLEKIEAEWGFYLSYLAQDTGDGRAVTVHELLPEELITRAADGTVNGKSEEAQEKMAWAGQRFLQEGRSLMACAHPALQKIIEVFEANGTAYWVTPRDELHTFKSWLQGLGRSPTEAELRRFFEPLLDGLERAHAEERYHLNLKPESIQITTGGQPVLARFGSARQAIARHCHDAAAVTTGYSAPEQYALEYVQGPRTDIHGLGAILYRGITGQAPPDAEERLRNDSCQKLADRFAGKYHENFLAAIDAALALDPAARPASVGEWGKMLASAAGDGVPGYLRRQPRLALWGAVVVATLALGTWFIFRPKPTPITKPTPTPTATPITTPTATPTPVLTPTATPTDTPTPVPSPTPTPSPTPALSPSPSPSPTPIPSSTPVPSPTPTPTPAPSSTPTPSLTPSPSATPSPTPEPSSSPQDLKSAEKEKETAREERLAAEKEAAVRAELEKNAKEEAAHAAEEAKKAEAKAEAAKQAAKEAPQKANPQKAAAAQKEAAKAKAEAEKAALAKETAKVAAALAGVQKATSEEVAASKALNEKAAAEKIASAATQAAAENKQAENALAEAKATENAAAAEHLAAQKKAAEKSVATASAKEGFAKATADLKTFQARLAAEKAAEAETAEKQLANKTAAQKADAEEARQKAGEARSAAESATEEKTKAEQFVAEMTAETEAAKKRAAEEIAEAERAAAEKAAQDKRAAEIAKQKAEKAAAERIAAEKAAQEKHEMAAQKAAAENAAAEKAAAEKAAAEKAAQAGNDPNAGKYKQLQASPAPSQQPTTTNRQGSTGTAMAGIWETTSTDAHGKPNRRLIIYNDGRYEISDNEGWKDTGAIIAAMGRIQMLSDATQVVVRSSFKLRTLSKIVTAGALGDEEWARVGSSPGNDPKSPKK